MNHSAKGAASEEYRGYRNNRLAIIEWLPAVTMVDYGVPVFEKTKYISIRVHFTQQLAPIFRIYQRKWTDRAAEFLGFSKANILKTGDKQFDKLFLVHGEKKDVVQSLHPDLRSAMIDFVTKEPMIYTRVGSLEMNQDAISYSEGPYLSASTSNITLDADFIVDRLLHLANLVEPDKGELPRRGK